MTSELNSETHGFYTDLAGKIIKKNLFDFLAFHKILSFSFFFKILKFFPEPDLGNQIGHQNSIVIPFLYKKEVAEMLRIEPGPCGFKLDTLPLSQQANLIQALIISELTLLKV